MKVPPHKSWTVTGRFSIEVRAETEEDAVRAADDLEIFDGSVEVSGVKAKERRD